MAKRVVAAGWLAPMVAVVTLAPADQSVSAAAGRRFKTEPRADILGAAFEACDMQLMVGVHASRAARRG